MINSLSGHMAVRGISVLYESPDIVELSLRAQQSWGLLFLPEQSVFMNTFSTETQRTQR
jgi:hypothetical protein